jgi:hypothetical protein
MAHRVYLFISHLLADLCITEVQISQFHKPESFLLNFLLFQLLLLILIFLIRRPQLHFVVDDIQQLLLDNLLLLQQLLLYLLLLQQLLFIHFFHHWVLLRLTSLSELIENIIGSLQDISIHRRRIYFLINKIPDCYYLLSFLDPNSWFRFVLQSFECLLHVKYFFCYPLIKSTLNGRQFSNQYAVFKTLQIQVTVSIEIWLQQLYPQFYYRHFIKKTMINVFPRNGPFLGLPPRISKN